MKSTAGLSAAALLGVAVAGCGDRTDPAADPMPGNEVLLGDDRGGIPSAGNPLPELPPPRPPAPDEGGLRPLSRADIERELEPGAGCSLDDSGRGPLLVAVEGDAIVDQRGRIVHLKPEARTLGALMRGGRFTGDGLVLEIDREHQVEQEGEVTTWQATLRMRRGKLGFTSFHHRWSCGA